MADFRFSSSIIKRYKNCPFSFFCKVTNQPQDADQNIDYGNAGNVVHKTAEYYFTNLLSMEKDTAINELKSFFEILWSDTNINANKINKDEYWLSVINILKLNVFPTDFEFEGKFKLNGNEVISYMDVINRNEHWIGDWKTSNYKSKKLEEYKEQLKFYSWIYQKLFGVIPMCWVFFTKSNKLFKFKFSEDSLKKVEADVMKINDEIKTRFKQMDFERRPSRTNCFFCPYKEICSGDLLRGKEAEKMEFTFHLKKNKLIIEGEIPDIIHRKMEHEINFEVKNAFFIKQVLLSRGVHFDGIKRLYRRKPVGAETFIGYQEVVFKVLKEYADSKGMKLALTIKDYRNQEVMNTTKLWDTSSPLNIDFKLYGFQEEAVRTLLSHEWGICEIGTGGGKTAIAAECIRQVGTTTLFVIDNKDLLMQTKDEYEKMLGVECGIVGMGFSDWSKPITLSTIQTLHKHAKEYAPQLSNINMLIGDETHIWAAKSFEEISKYLINTKYRLGFSATAKRDDGNDKIIFAHMGIVVFKKNAADLIQEDVLVNPIAIFYDYGKSISITDTWQNEYNDGIVDNEERNRIIREIVAKYRAQGKQIMVLCKMIRHCESFKNLIDDSELIYGRTDDDIRYDILEKFKANEVQVLIGNLKIFNKGINLKNLDVLINASGNAGEVTTVQSMGRILRKNPGKENAYYIDFMDNGEYLKKHSLNRISALKDEDYDVQIEKYSE